MIHTRQVTEYAKGCDRCGRFLHTEDYRFEDYRWYIDEESANLEHEEDGFDAVDGKYYCVHCITSEYYEPLPPIPYKRSPYCDKEGRFIHEGDIVEVDGCQASCALSKFGADPIWVLQFSVNPRVESIQGYEQEDLTIIGNIHDKPEKQW